ncbi:hypothetical protein FNV43_RR05281 [Rhamnella rubrinervis]|uniref:Transcription factor Iwr1 domain-containing protein n=1 Tax=Rhamnella rubrinervis TaxID=2594499 RepID=A0A8K0HMM9_9ROSA|nr:hypothetical protein FNV43_RR05281 [Rhamnella rubrinervis]
MAAHGESSSAPLKPTDGKPVFVRVKRKTFQSRLDGFWLEINERPLKRPLLDFEKLSLSDSSGKEELKAKKVFVRHVETVKTTEITADIVHSFVESNLANASQSKTKSEERRRTFKKENQRHDQLLSKSIQKQEVTSKNARFEQIWRSRRGNKEAGHEKLHEICRFYDVVRVDVEERSNEVQQLEEDLEDQRILSSYLPLLREFIPSAAEEIESDIHANKFRQASTDDFVYDYYTVKDEMDMGNVDASHPFPLVQVDEDEDFYDGPDDTEYETDDSNAENNPMNDYPDETSEEEEDAESKSSENDSKEKDTSSESKDLEDRGLSDDANLLCEDDIYDFDGYEGDDFDCYDDNDSGGCDGEDWG